MTPHADNAITIKIIGNHETIAARDGSTPVARGLFPTVAVVLINYSFQLLSKKRPAKGSAKTAWKLSEIVVSACYSNVTKA